MYSDGKIRKAGSVRKNEGRCVSTAGIRRGYYMDGRLHNWVNWILYDELIDGKINAPKHLLGNHDFGDGQVITCYKPHSSSVSVKTPAGKTLTPMERIGEDGFYGIYFPKKKFKGTKYRHITKFLDLLP